jgi:hypothetical protein
MVVQLTALSMEGILLTYTVFRCFGRQRFKDNLMVFHVICVQSDSDGIQRSMTCIRKDPKHMKTATEKTPEYLTVLVITVM